MDTSGRRSGILLPLFSLRSRTDWGIGDFSALPGLFDWMVEARQRLLLLLPLLPTAPNDCSPYATRSAFGLNPLFIDPSTLPEVQALGGEGMLPDDERRTLDAVRAAPRIQYDAVLPLKSKMLRRAFGRFVADGPDTERAVRFTRYRETEGAWLDNYTLFAALSEERGLQAWWEWEAPLRDREPAALDAARARLTDELTFRAWLQWVAEEQWRGVREAARERDVLLCGDEPFIVGQDSADVWANPRLLRRDARLGVPPDDFSATGQDWGLPYFDFQAMEADDLAWLRARARKTATYYDLRRVDHAVGYFRQYLRVPGEQLGNFRPADEAEQRRLGDRLFRVLKEEPGGVVAEDLGVIPDFVRETLAAIDIPGYKVMRWERDGLRYRDPRAFPPSSLVTTGTHDTDTLREWWEGAEQTERDAMAEVYQELWGMPADGTWTAATHGALLAACENARSDLCVLPWQDVLGTTDRINLPGSQQDANWSYRIDQPASELLEDPVTRGAAELLAKLTVEANRAEAKGETR